MSLEAAGLAAALYAGGMYLNAKFNICDDLSALSSMRKASRYFARAEKENRLSVWYIADAAFKRHAQRRAIWTRQESLSFQACHLRIIQFANWLLVKGVGPDDCFAMYMKNSVDFILLWFAAACIGAYPAFLNYNLEGDSLLRCLKICEPKLLLVSPDEDCVERTQRDGDAIRDMEIETIVMDAVTKNEVSSMPSVVPDESYRDHVTGETPVVLIYTSGTTGMPKACPLTHRQILMSGAHLEPPHGSIPGQHYWYNPMPMYHGTGGITSFGVLLSGVGIALAPKFSVSQFWTDIYESGATHFIYVGETARYLVNSPPHPLERQHKLMCAYGNGLRPDVWTRFQERFNIPEVVEIFSSTEGMFRLLNSARGPFNVGSVGRHGLLRRMLLHNTFVLVKVDYETGDIWRDAATGFARRMPYEEGGELLMALPNKKAFQGYWKSPDATEKKLCLDVFRQGDVYYRTGDALRRSSEGLWYFLDRLGDTYRWKSENVSTAEVAEVLGRFPGILEATVYGVELPNHDGRAGCAAVRLSPEFSATPDYEALAKHLSKSLPSYAVPVFLRVMRTGSYTDNHKQNKVPLKREGVNPKLAGTVVPGGGQDGFLWLLPKSGTYTSFTQVDWDKLETCRARL
ncbi:hypothetical protein NW759_016487 [Fusarium solani]|nr:hypothetical protein NW759_016487 [Fusarium solani]